MACVCELCLDDTICALLLPVPCPLSPARYVLTMSPGQDPMNILPFAPVYYDKRDHVMKSKDMSRPDDFIEISGSKVRPSPTASEPYYGPAKRPVSAPFVQSPSHHEMESYNTPLPSSRRCVNWRRRGPSPAT